MYPEYAPAETAMSLEGHDEPDSRLHGKRLILARAACLAAGILSFGVFVISVPATYEAILSQFCAGPLCNLPSQVSVQFVQQLQALGLSIPAYAIYYVMLDVIFVCTYFVVAIMLFWRRSDDWMALFAAFFLMSFALTFSSDTLEATPYWVFQFVIFLGAVSIVVFFYLFPTGRFVPRWTRWLSIAAIFYWGLKYFLPPFPFNPYTNIIFTNSAFFLFVGAMIVAQVYRYLRVSSSVQRQQTKWVVFGVSIGIGGYLLFALLFVLFFPSASQSPLAGILLNTVDHLLLLLIPISIAFAILRSRLWDIDIIINRTLVYGLLTGTLALIYVSLVIGLQYLLRLVSVQASSLVLVGSTLMIAAIFQPLRRRLQRTINHLMYGERNDPYAVLTRLGLRLEATLAPDAVLPTIVETVAQTLKLAYVAITLTTDERRPIPDQASPLADTFVTVASYGSPTAHPLRLPLVYQTETLGYLLIGPRPGETLTSANQRLLTDLARQIGISAHSVQLTTELQQARESLVLAREEERRRLRRDLHDGLGPQLASQTLTLTTARKLLRQDPDAADELLAAATIHAQEAITDIRRLVYALRPPALDDLGLVAALREQATQYGSSGVVIILEAPEQLPPLPAAVEVACYRIVQEALTNVVRHAHAHTCTIRLFVNESLCLEVTDDGDGLPTAYRAGVGLTSMRERAKELGGTCVIDRVTGGGTRVCAQLPLL